MSDNQSEYENPLHNPYQAPQVDTDNADFQGGENDPLTPLMRKHLIDASPWMRFLGVIFYISAAMMAFGGIGMVLVMLSTGLFGGDNLDWHMGLLAIVYLISGGIFLLPARYTFNAGAGIRSYSLNRVPKDLEAALENNKSLWKFYGILTIVYLALIPLAFLVGLGLAVFNAL